MALARSGSIVLAANIADMGASLVRNIVLARLLSVEQFGLAATFSILLTLLDAAQSVGINRMIVQDRDADDPAFLRSLHGVQAMLGVATCVLMFVLAWPYALAMNTPALVAAYAVLAVVPLMRGFTHLETFRMQREGRFVPGITRMLAAQLVGLAALVPAYFWLGDYRVMLVSILAQQIASVVLSHVVAGPRFAIGRDPAIWRRAFAFGWPLLLNGLLMFLVLNGDRIVVSNRFGPEMLGWFSAAFMLTLLPINLIAKSLQTVLLPAMARAQDAPERLQRQYELATSMTLLVAVGFVAGIAVLGPWAMTLLFGQKFAPAAPFLLLLAVMQSLRLARAVPAIAAMARAETRNPLYTNIVRALYIPVAFAVAVWTGDIYLMLVCGIVGEFVAAVAAAMLAQSMVRLRARGFQIRFLVSTLASAAIVLASLVSAWWSLAAIACLLLLLYQCRDFLLHSRDLLRR
jgi:O-antigen/teichoic acid export membrane protein